MQSWIDQNRFLVFIALAVISIGGVFWVYLRQPDPPPVMVISPIDTPTPQATSTSIPTSTPAPLRVYVSGEVRHPDVYTLPPGSIIKDAIYAAGGATGDANLDVVNLAQALQDQQHIHIPAQADNLPTPPVVEGGVKTVSMPKSANETPATLVVNLNTATVAQLELLPGIGPAIAQRIVDYRTANGNFSTIEQLMEVKGIGQATFDKLKDNIVVE